MSLWTTDIADGTVVATYHNPPMNYFCAEGTRELSQLIEEWRDPTIRVVILTGGMPGKFITHYSVACGNPEDSNLLVPENAVLIGDCNLFSAPLDKGFMS